MTLEEYRIQCGWSINEMARKAGMDYTTLKKALTGERISANTANKLARAISKELNITLRANQIEGLNIIL